MVSGLACWFHSCFLGSDNTNSQVQGQQLQPKEPIADLVSTKFWYYWPDSFSHRICWKKFSREKKNVINFFWVSHYFQIMTIKKEKNIRSQLKSYWKFKKKIAPITHNAFIALYFLLCLSGKNIKYALAAGCEKVKFYVLFFCALTI